MSVPRWRWRGLAQSQRRVERAFRIDVVRRRHPILLPQNTGVCTHYAGLDVSLEETAICVVDEAGQILKEVRAPSEPEALIIALRAIDLPLERVGSRFSNWCAARRY